MKYETVKFHLERLAYGAEGTLPTDLAWRHQVRETLACFRPELQDARC